MGRASEESSGYELVISAVKPSDKGEYVCSGTNSVTGSPQEVKFMLDVQGERTELSLCLKICVRSRSKMVSKSKVRKIRIDYLVHY